MTEISLRQIKKFSTEIAEKILPIDLFGLKLGDPSHEIKGRLISNSLKLYITSHFFWDNSVQKSMLLFVT